MGSFSGKRYKSCIDIIAKDRALTAKDRPYSRITIEFLFTLNQEKNLCAKNPRTPMVTSSIIAVVAISISVWYCEVIRISYTTNIIIATSTYMAAITMLLINLTLRSFALISLLCLLTNSV